MSIPIKYKDPKEIHELLLSQAREELEKAIVEHSEWVETLRGAKMVQLAAQGSENDILEDSEKALLEEGHILIQALEQKVVFWQRRIERLKKYNPRKFPHKRN